MEYCCNLWAGAPSCYLKLLDKLQKRICRTADPSLATSHEPLAHCWNVASLRLFYTYYLGRCSSELAWLVPLPFSWGRSTRYNDRLHDFSVTIPRCYKDVNVNSFCPHTARLWNYKPTKCFPLTYNLNGFKSRINRHPLTVGSFWRDFLYALIFNLVYFFFLQLHAMEWLFHLSKFTSAVDNCRGYCQGKQCFYSNRLSKNIAEVITC